MIAGAGTIHKRSLLLYHCGFRLKIIVTPILILIPELLKGAVMWVEDYYREEDFRVFSGQ